MPAAPEEDAVAACSSLSTLAVQWLDPEMGILEVAINRPARSNAMNKAFWVEMRESFARIGLDRRVRVVVLSGRGKNFSAGLDLQDTELSGPGHGSSTPKSAGRKRSRTTSTTTTTTSSSSRSSDDSSSSCVARRAFKWRAVASAMQESFTAMTRLPVPVIAAVHGAAIGGAVDMITAADIRLCAPCASFSVKEVQIGLAADVGTLQRLPKVVGNNSWVRYVCLTGVTFGAAEALQHGLVSHVCQEGGREAVVRAALEVARRIAAHSPVAVYGTKHNLNYSQDHSVADGLDYIATWNGAALQTEDIQRSVTGFLTKKTPLFSKL